MNNTKAKHTPGPWSVDEDCPIDVMAPDNANIKYVVVQDITVIDASNIVGMEERIANARLISAAPDMLEVLKTVLRNGLTKEGWKSADTHEHARRLAEIQAVILKAEGGSNE